MKDRLRLVPLSSLELYSVPLSRIIQNANLQVTHVETLCTTVRITALQSRYYGVKFPYQVRLLPLICVAVASSILHALTVLATLPLRITHSSLHNRL